MSEKRYSLREVLQNLLFPPRCAFCGALIGWEEALCSTCRAVAKKPFCKREDDVFGCDGLLWCGEYRDLLRTGMERFKFRGVRAGASLFGGMLLLALRESGVAEQVNFITFVPMPQGRERRRGYNQARLLAEYIAENLALPLRDDLLCRRGHKATHTASGRRERARLTQESYLHGTGECPAGAGILLVDDIVTTGATLAACAALLRQKGAGSVMAAAVLRTPAPKGSKEPAK